MKDQCGYNVSYGGGMQLNAYAYKDKVTISNGNFGVTSSSYFGGIYQVLNAFNKKGTNFRKFFQSKKRDINNQYPEVNLFLFFILIF